jgi:hypothetical protein
MDVHEEEAHLAVLRSSHPAFAFWPETVRDRRRYVAQRLDWHQGLWTAISSSLDELREALDESGQLQSPRP